MEDFFVYGLTNNMKIKSVKFVTSAAKVRQAPSDALPHIAFAGRSNVGKSSLLNALFNRKKMALVSSTPGKTRLLNFFLVNESIYFVDLPGYGFAKVPMKIKEQWGHLVENYLQHSENLKCVVVLTDSRHEVQKMDRQLVDWLARNDIPFIVVGTKADKLTKNKLNAQLAQNCKNLAESNVKKIVPFSVVSKLGKVELLNEIAKFL